MIPLQSNPPWFEEWFGSELYSRVYSHRSEQEAQSTMELFRRNVPLPRAAKVLDLCCGSGRHARALAEEGYRVLGIDLSATLLEIARQSSDGMKGPNYVRQDMRAAYPDAPYACVTNFFTSFGYFDERSDDLKVLHRVAEALERPGGYFFFDYLNADYTRSALLAHEHKTLGGISVEMRRSIVEPFVRKEITIRDCEREHSFTEQVRLYQLHDFEKMFGQVSLRIHKTFGNYDGAPFTPTSPRLIIIARAE